MSSDFLGALHGCRAAAAGELSGADADARPARRRARRGWNDLDGGHPPAREAAAPDPAQTADGAVGYGNMLSIWREAVPNLPSLRKSGNMGYGSLPYRP